MPDHARLAALIADFAVSHAHFLQTIVPLWQGPGWNPALELPYEAVDALQQPLPVQHYRAMACARQLYVFARHIDQPGARERATALFRSLQRHFHDTEHGGWYYSVDAHGKPLDRRKDLYTHAFIVFACAHYSAKTTEPLIVSTLEAALNLVAARFPTSDGLYEACLAEDWSTLQSGPLQNPLMHLAEAFLATLQVRQDPGIQQALLDLCAVMQARFVDPGSSVMLEKPLGAVDNWSEPGHQFEWFFLLESSALMRGGSLHRSLAKAFSHAEACGVRDGAVVSMLNVDGSVRDATQRVWAQAEYLRALTMLPDGRERVAQQLDVLRQQFLHPLGWYECRDSGGQVSRSDMPSTTPYHLDTCYQGLQAYLGVSQP